MKTTHKAIAALMLLAAASIAAAGCGSSGAQTDAGGKQAAAAQHLADAPEQTQALFKQNCMSCHGANLEGKVGPKTNLQQVGARLTKEQIAKQITNGGNGMMGFGGKLQPEQVTALADWLAAKK